MVGASKLDGVALELYMLLIGGCCGRCISGLWSTDGKYQNLKKVESYTEGLLEAYSNKLFNKVI
jgi:hypothetical protein